MSFSELYESGTQKSDILHFAIIAKMARVDGEINEPEQHMLDKVARKLGIGENQAQTIVSRLNEYPIPSVNSKEERLEYLFELFKMIYVDHRIDAPEMLFIRKYAIGLGFSQDQAKMYIDASIKLFGGNFSFSEYHWFIDLLTEKIKNSL